MKPTIRSNSFSNGNGGNSGMGGLNQGPATVTVTGQRLGPDHWWYLV